MARSIILATFLAFSAAPTFACGNAMKTQEGETQAKEETEEAPPANLALLGLAGVGLAGLAGAFALRSRS